MTQPESFPQLRSHQLKVALINPQIAPNTGNIARTCVTTGTELHLVRPLGFVLSDRNLRRSAMDYWSRLKLTVHDDISTFTEVMQADGGGIWLFSSRAKQSLWQTEFSDGNWLVFGSETKGIPPEVLAAYPRRTVRIPQIEGERCLNLATAAGVGIYEALRQINAIEK